MDRLEKHADAFEDSFERALDSSSYNGTPTEDALARWADMLQDEIDDMVKSFKSKDSAELIRHFENSMIAASAVKELAPPQHGQLD